METVYSPVTGSPAYHIKDLEVSLIIDAYKKELDLAIDKYVAKYKEISIYGCPDTGYRFYYPFTVFADSDFYTQLDKANSKYYEAWKWENQVAAKYIQPDNYILDVGCGAGLFLKELQKKGMKHLYGIDFALAPNAIEDKSIHLEANTISKFCVEYAGRFDMVTCFQVLEHISEVKEFIDDCLKCLKPGGKLIIAVPNSHPYIFKQDTYHTLNMPPHHAGLWDANALKKLCRYFPMELVDIQYQPIGTSLNYYIYVQIDYLMNKSAVLHIVWKNRIVRALYRRYIYAIKNYVKGHSQVVVYVKKES